MERQLECGCYVSVDEEALEAVVEAEAFLCGRRHRQGDRVALGRDLNPLPDVHPEQQRLA